MDNPGLGLYTYTLQLANGTHDYKFINGGDWQVKSQYPRSVVLTTVMADTTVRWLWLDRT